MISAMLLAAGESTRMGQLKALLPWDGVTLLEYQLRELIASGAGETVVVLGHAVEQLEPIARRPGARIVVNPQYRSGRSSSIRAGIRALSPEASGVLIHSVDQPRPRQVIDRLVETHIRRGSMITRPAYGDKHGHPTIFARRYFDELLDLSEETEGLKALLRLHASAVLDLAFDDPIVLLNLNRPADYQAALARLSRGSLS